MSPHLVEPLPGVTVEHAPTELRYVVLLDGEGVGFTRYADHDGQRVFLHTEIDEAHTRHGLAAELIAFALADTAAAGMRIVAVCPYVQRYLREHHEWDDILDPATPRVLAELREDRR